jgi:branched-chain amino acid transport system ATP-binding protein
MYILEIENVSKSFGGLMALNQVNIEFVEGEILGVIGPNGAGKTTLINLVSGIYLPESGRIVFDGRDITTLPTHIRCRHGIGRTFQVIRPFEDLNLVQNIMVGSLFGQGIGLREARLKAQEICNYLGLSQIERDTTQLTILEIKKMEIAHALATQPKILFLDEIMAGLSTEEIREVISTVRSIRDQGITICIVEHVMSVIKELTERVIVLDGGKVVAQGQYEEVTQNPRVVSAYLGEEG